MKIKRRTEVTIVTHEITLLRIQNGEADAERFGGDKKRLGSDDVLVEEDREGEGYEAEKNDS